MHKTLGIIALMAALGLSSCETLEWSQVQAQAAEWVDLESAVTFIVSDVLKKYPESESKFRSIKTTLNILAKKDSLTKEEVQPAIELIIKANHPKHEQELLYACHKIFAKIKDGASIDLVEYRAELEAVAAGIDWALKFQGQKEVTTGK